VAESKTVTATVAGFTLTTTVTFTAGVPSSANSSITASPSSVVANGTSTTTLTVTIRDAQGNVLPNVTVNLSSTGTANAFTPASGTTNGSGVFTATLSSTRAEAKTVTASGSGYSVSTGVTFTAGNPVAANSTLTATPRNVASDGVSTTTLAVVLRDQFNNPVSGQSVSFSATGSNNLWTPSTPSGSTDSTGTFSVRLASTTKETKTVTATTSFFALMTDVTFGCTVLVLGDDQTTHTNNFATALSNAGLVPTVVNNGGINYTGTPAASNFTAVVVMVGNNFETDMPAAGQTAITSANSSGTGVVLMEWAAYHVLNNRWQTLRNLLLFSRTSGVSGNLTFSLESSGHPIWEGVPGTFTTSVAMGANVGNTLINGGQRIAGCSQCSSIGVAVRDSVGRIVQLAHAGNWNNGGTAWTSDANTTRMTVNSVRWAGRCQ
ncbi:MAG: Ig-like domain-containing protein, partial [Myxococcales bacterium]